MGTITVVGRDVTISDGTNTYYLRGGSIRELFVEDGVMYGYQVSGGSAKVFGRFDIPDGATLSTDPNNPTTLDFTRVQLDDDGDGTTDRDVINGAGDQYQGADIFDSTENTAMILDDNALRLFDLDDNTYATIKAPDGNDFAFSSTTTGSSSYRVTAMDVSTDADGNKYLFYTTTYESGGVGKIWRAELDQNMSGDWVISNHVELEHNSRATSTGGIGEAHTIDIVSNPDAPGGKSIVINGKYITADHLDIYNATNFGTVNDGDYVHLGSEQYAGAETQQDTGFLIFATWNGALPAFVCFVDGTEIDTENGPRLIEDLKVGDRVITQDRGPQEVRWIGRKDLSWLDLIENPHLRPVRIRAGALGPGSPRRDLLLSPQHRVLVRSKISRRMFESAEVLVAAVRLVGLPGIERVSGMVGLTYYHFRTDHHEIISSNGALTETMLDTAYVRGALAEEHAMLTEVPPQCTKAAPARIIAERKKCKTLIARHASNRQELVSGFSEAQMALYF